MAGIVKKRSIEPYSDIGCHTEKEKHNNYKRAFLQSLEERLFFMPQFVYMKIPCKRNFFFGCEVFLFTRHIYNGLIRLGIANIQ